MGAICARPLGADLTGVRLPVRTRILRTLSRINEAHPWSHNNAYAPFVLYQAWRARRAGAVTGLDVGCGTGDLLRRLARVLPQVSGLEPDPATAEKASAATRGLDNATVVSGSFPTTEPSRYDFVSMLAVLHHLPLEDGIRAAKESLKPGGRLVIVGCFEGPAAQWSEVLSLGSTRSSGSSSTRVVPHAYQNA